MVFEPGVEGPVSVAKFIRRELSFIRRIMLAPEVTSEFGELALKRAKHVSEFLLSQRSLAFWRDTFWPFCSRDAFKRQRNKFDFGGLLNSKNECTAKDCGRLSVILLGSESP